MVLRVRNTTLHLRTGRKGESGGIFSSNSLDRKLTQCHLYTTRRALEGDGEREHSIEHIMLICIKYEAPSFQERRIVEQDVKHSCIYSTPQMYREIITTVRDAVIYLNNSNRIKYILCQISKIES